MSETKINEEVDALELQMSASSASPAATLDLLTSTLTEDCHGEDHAKQACQFKCGSCGQMLTPSCSQVQTPKSSDALPIPRQDRPDIVAMFDTQHAQPIATVSSVGVFVSVFVSVCRVPTALFAPRKAA
eukprot:60618-Amphidinium_carterae.1